MSVAEHIIKKLGGVPRVAKLTGRRPSVVYRWTYPKSKGGTGGAIPRDAQESLWALSQAGEIDLTAMDFMPQPPQEAPQ